MSIKLNFIREVDRSEKLYDPFRESLVSKVQNFSLSALREGAYMLSVAAYRVYYLFNDKPVEYTSNLPWKENSQGLFLPIHGLRGNSLVWHRHLKILKNECPNYDVRIPTVFNLGNCSLEEAIDPIEKVVVDYIEKHPGRPVCLLATSNGSRIASLLEYRLRSKYSQTPIHVSMIAAVYSGSKMMNLLERLHLAKWMFHQSVIEQLKYKSPYSKELKKKIRETLPFGVQRKYDFFASLHDFYVFPFKSAHPKISSIKANYFLTSGYSHCSIVSAVASLQIQRSLDWIKGLQ